MPLEYLLIANPVSGRGRALRLAESVLVHLRRVGRGVELARSAGPGDTREKAAEAVARGVPVVVACGGDGTVQEAASALAGTDGVLGVLPGGRCNDFARALEIHRGDAPDALARMLLEGPTRRVDLGRCVPLAGNPSGESAAFDEKKSRIFCTVATLGFDSAVTRFVREHRFPIKGTAEYLYGGLRVLLNFQPPRVKLKGDFGEFEGRIFLAATGNAPSYGGAMRIAPGAKLDDGTFHLCLIEAISKITMLRMLPTVFRGGHVAHPSVRVLQTRKVEIETFGQPEWICADGEVLAQTPVRLEIMPRAIQVKVRE